MSAPRTNLDVRHQYAELLRHFISGRMTNFEYEDRASELRMADDSVWDIYKVVWHLYCDIREHRMTDPDRRQPAHVRRVVARFVVFLRSDTAGIAPDFAPIHEPVDFRLTVPAMLAGMILLASAAVAWFASATPLAVCLVFSGWLLIGFASLGEPGMVPTAMLARLFSPQSTECWPFVSEDALHTASRRPTFLHG